MDMCGDAFAKVVDVDPGMQPSTPAPDTSQRHEVAVFRENLSAQGLRLWVILC